MRSSKISKREFLRRCAVCAGGFALGAYRSVSAEPESPLKKDKWTKEALFYTKTADGLRCDKCPHGCLLTDDDPTGTCRSRVAYDGKMYSISYGNPCAVHIDPIEKKPFFHFLPTTLAFSIAAAGCNFRCLNCQNWQISQAGPGETENTDLMPPEAVRACVNAGCRSIAYTYSEPVTFYEYAYDTAALARERKLKNLWKSNGYINEKPLRQLCKVIDAANIDLKVFDDDIYRKISSGRLDPVLKTLKIFRDEGVWLEITNLVIPTWTDDIDIIKRMCGWLCDNGLSDAPLHFSRFTPMYKLGQLPPTPVSTLEKARNTAIQAGIKYVYLGNTTGHKGENTYCPRCGKIVIERRMFTVIANNLSEGKCKFCGEKISGIWS
jgi:pyruvate formate lyase activating enzyme